MPKSKKKKYSSKTKNAFVGKTTDVAKETKRSFFKKLTSFANRGFHNKWIKTFQKKNSNKTNNQQLTTNNPKPQAPSPKLRKIVKILLFPILNPYFRFLLIILFAASVLGVMYILRDLPSPRKLTSKDNYAVSTQIFDRRGVLLYEIFADENRIPIDADTLPDYVKQATIAIEDKNFYKHFGFDIRGITRALINNLKGEPVEGGSTITQQLVKNALLTPERSVKRKVKEGVLAIATEVIYSKDEILEMYLNYISYGGTSVGIQAASQSYFDKDAKDLTLAEASLLVGLPQAPSRYSPFGSNPEQAKARQKEVLRRMVEDGYITQLQADEAAGEKLQFAISKTDIKAPHFVFYVRDYLYEKYGVETVEKGGLRVTTTLDLNLQEVAQASLSAEVANLKRLKVGNGAAMIVKPNTGEILSMIGSKDYFSEEEDGNVNVALAYRQPGSSIKPIMYATTFQEKTLNPGTYLLDVPTCFTAPGQQPYCPKNYDGTFKGPVTIRTALGNSLNIPAVKAIRTIGVEKFIDQAEKMGITSWEDPSNYGLSLALGGGEVRMIDMAQTFGVLANQGVKVPLTPILEVKDYKGNLIDKTDIEQRKEDLAYLNNYEDTISEGDLERVMDKAPAYLVSHIMQDNKARQAAFGSRSELVIPNQIVSAKTGTTNNLKDNWTVGFTPEFLTITWVGNNDNTPMNQYLVSGVTGAAPIWNDIMSYVLKDQEPVWQEKPLDVASGQVCASGMPPQGSDKCKIIGTELYWQKSKPSDSQVITKEIWIKSDTGLPPAQGEQADNLVLENKTIYTDPVTPQYCSDCARATTEDGKVVYERNSVSHDYVVQE